MGKSRRGLRRPGLRTNPSKRREKNKDPLGVFTSPGYEVLGYNSNFRHYLNKDSAQTRLLKAFLEQEAQLRGYLHRFTDSDHDLDDICQETMARGLEAVKDRQVRHPGAFLFGIARNIVRKRFERKSRSLIDFIADFSPDDHVADVRPLDDIMDEQERLTRYDEAIARLPPQCQRVFVMRKVYGYSHREIAGMLSISIKTVENHISTGLKRCSEEIAVIEGSTQQHKTVINFPKRH